MSNYGDPFGHDPAWIMDRLSAAGATTPAVARVVTRQFQETGALLEKAGADMP